MPDPFLHLGSDLWSMSPVRKGEGSPTSSPHQVSISDLVSRCLGRHRKLRLPPGIFFACPVREGVLLKPEQRPVLAWDRKLPDSE